MTANHREEGKRSVESSSKRNSGLPMDLLFHLLDGAPLAMLFVSKEGQVTYANQRANRILGVELMGLCYHHIEEIFGPQSLDQICNAIDECGDTTSSVALNLNILFTSPTGRFFRGAVLPFHLRDEFHYCLYFDDVTQRRQMERELKERNAFFRNLLDATEEAFVAADMEGNIILFNRRAQETLGYSEREALTELDLETLYPNGQVADILRAVHGEGGFRRQVVQVRSAGGEEIPMNAAGGIVYNESRRELATYFLLTDLREERRMKTEITTARKMLERSERMAVLGKLAASIAHELNHPLSTILLFSSLVVEEAGGDLPFSEDLRRIEDEAKRCQRIIRELLEFSNVARYQKRLLNLNDVVTKTVGLIERLPLFRGVKIDLNLAEELPRIWGDVGKLQQVLFNIAINAAEAMPEGGCFEIVTSHIPVDDCVEIVLRDEGVGMPADVVRNAFEPFFTTKEIGKGTGLGLAVSFAIVNEHKAEISVSSEEGAGTSFTIAFPLSIARDNQED